MIDLPKSADQRNMGRRSAGAEPGLAVLAPPHTRTSEESFSKTQSTIHNFAHSLFSLMSDYDGDLFVDWLVAAMMAHSVTTAHFEFYPQPVVPPELARCRGVAPVIYHYAAWLPDFVARSGLALSGIRRVELDLVADWSHCWRNASSRWTGHVRFDIVAQCHRENGAVVTDVRHLPWPMFGPGVVHTDEPPPDPREASASS